MHYLRIFHVLISSQTGLIPTLIDNLSVHSSLAQELCDAEVTLEALTHLQRCRTEFRAFVLFVETGELSDAMRMCSILEPLLEDPPVALARTTVMKDLRVCDLG